MPTQTHIESLITAAATPFEPRLCRIPGCDAIVTEPWEESATLCANCAVEAELSDRYARWERSFPVDWTPETFPAS